MSNITDGKQEPKSSPKKEVKAITERTQLLPKNKVKTVAKTQQGKNKAKVMDEDAQLLPKEKPKINWLGWALFVGVICVLAAIYLANIVSMLPVIPLCAGAFLLGLLVVFVQKKYTESKEKIKIETINKKVLCVRQGLFEKVIQLKNNGKVINHHKVDKSETAVTYEELPTKKRYKCEVAFNVAENHWVIQLKRLSWWGGQTLVATHKISDIQKQGGEEAGNPFDPKNEQSSIRHIKLFQRIIDLGEYKKRLDEADSEALGGLKQKLQQVSVSDTGVVYKDELTNKLHQCEVYFDAKKQDWVLQASRISKSGLIEEILKTYTISELEGYDFESEDEDQPAVNFWNELEPEQRQKLSEYFLKEITDIKKEIKSGMLPLKLIQLPLKLIEHWEGGAEEGATPSLCYKDANGNEFYVTMSNDLLLIDLSKETVKINGSENFPRSFFLDESWLEFISDEKSSGRQLAPAKAPSPNVSFSYGTAPRSYPSAVRSAERDSKAEQESPKL